MMLLIGTQMATVQLCMVLPGRQVPIFPIFSYFMSNLLFSPIFLTNSYFFLFLGKYLIFTRTKNIVDYRQNVIDYPD